jgi:hypothetical protein
VKIRTRDGAPFEGGLAVLRRVVEARGDWQRLLPADGFDRICRASGGHLRDLFRLLREVLLRVRDLPAGTEEVDRALGSVRAEMQPIPDDDAVWLGRIADEHGVALEAMGDLFDLARFLDTHLVLCYRNGAEWYDVHPLVRDLVIEQAGRVRKVDATP